MVPLKGVQMIDGAQVKKQVWRPHFGTYGLSGTMCYIEESTWEHFWDVSTPSDLAAGPFAALAPHVTLLGQLFSNLYSDFIGELFSHSHCWYKSKLN